MPTISDVLRVCRTRLQVARDPGLLAVAGAVLLICAPVLPGFSRLVVLPALLLAPGYALLRLLGRATDLRSISVAVPVSLVLAVCASLVLDASGIRLGPLVLGSVLGGVTALFLAGSYGRDVWCPGAFTQVEITSVLPWLLRWSIRRTCLSTTAWTGTGAHP